MWRMVILVFLACLVGGCFFGDRAVTWQEALPKQTWLDEDASSRRSIVLRPDSTYTLAELSGEDTTGDRRMAKKTGTWQMLGSLLPLVQLEDGRIFRMQGHTQKPYDRCNVVASRSASLDRLDRPAEWFEAAPGVLVCLRDVAPYSDEFSVMGLLGGKPELGKQGAGAEIAERLEKAVPKGWCVSVLGDTVLVARDERVMIVNSVNAPAAGDSEEVRKGALKERYVIILRVMPRMTDAEYRAVAEQNQRTAAKIDGLEKQMKGVAHKFDDYLPKDDRERAMLAELRGLERDYKEMPTHYDAGHSYVIVDTLGGFWAMVDVPADIERARSIVDGMMEKYPGE